MIGKTKTYKGMLYVSYDSSKVTLQQSHKTIQKELSNLVHTFTDMIML